MAIGLGCNAKSSHHLALACCDYLILLQRVVLSDEGKSVHSNLLPEGRRKPIKIHGEKSMLPSDKIDKAFKAICEEAEKLRKKDLPDKVDKRLKTIISIAKHQSDIRGLKGGCCHPKTKCKV